MTSLISLDIWIQDLSVINTSELNFVSHLSIYLCLMPNDDKPTLITYLPNALCEDSLTKMH